MSPPRTPLHFATLILLTAASTLSLNMFLPSLASIATDLDAPYATVSIALSGYLAATAVVQLAVGPLSDRLGRRPVLLASLAIFVAASVLCALAGDIVTFLVFRMLQASMISGYVLSLAIVRDTTSERESASLIGYIGMAMALAPMLGPVLGGLLDSAFGWRANFVFYAVAGGALLLLCWANLEETRPAHTVDGAAVRAPLSALLRAPLFWAYALCGAFSTGAFYVFLTGAPLVAQAQFGVSTAELGLLIGSITAGFMAGSYLSGRFAAEVGPDRMILAGRTLACLGPAAGLAVALGGAATVWSFFGATVFVGLGNGMTIPGSNAGALSVRPDLAGSAAGLNGALIVALGAALTALTGAVLPAKDPAAALLALILAASAAGLIAALWARRLRRTDHGAGLRDTP